MEFVLIFFCFVAQFMSTKSENKIWEAKQDCLLVLFARNCASLGLPDQMLQRNLTFISC